MIYKESVTQNNALSNTQRVITLMSEIFSSHLFTWTKVILNRIHCNVLHKYNIVTIKFKIKYNDYS